MVSSLTSRPVSSVREQQASPRLPSITSTPRLRSNTIRGEPSPRISSILSTPILHSEDRHSSPFAASTRSSEHSFDRSSVSSFGQRSVSTAATFQHPSDVDHLPPIATLDIPKSDHHRLPLQTSWVDHSTRTSSSAAMNPVDKAELSVRRASPPPSLRRPASPAGRMSNHSAEWDMQSDRGSPHVAGRRPGPPLPPASSISGGAAVGAAHSGYARDYASSPRASYREAAYRDPRELSPPSAPGLKRKLSISSDMGPRRAMPDRIDRNGSAWAPSEYPSRAGYSEAGYYRGGRDRAESPERAYPASYSRDAAYSSRYADQRMDDPRYSPRHAHPASPSTSRTAYHRGYDTASTPSGHPYPVSRRSDRYSPVPSPRSPSYAPRQALPPNQSVAPPAAHDPYSRSAPHSSYMRRPQSPPPFASDSRPVLPPLSSRTSAAVPAPAASRYPAPPRVPGGGGRYTPPLEAAHAEKLSPTPEPHAYSEPFYPDRRLYFARERIQDPEMDEYYHGPLGSAGAGGAKGRYADPYYDPYGSPHAGSYAPPGMVKASNGAGPVPIPSPGMAPMSAHPGARHHDPRQPYGGSPYGPGSEYMHDPRDLHHALHPHHGGMPRPGGAMVGRPMPVPNTHVPPGPSAGIAPPPRRRGKLPKPVTDLLKSWLLEHASHPYPTEDEKRSLCNMTGLTLSQVSNWFINARRRILLPTGANGSPSGGSTAAQVKAAFRDDSASPGPNE